MLGFKWMKPTTAVEDNHLLELLLSTLGVFVAMVTLIGVMSWLDKTAALPWLVVASMGASALILFATPHAPMAQPWALIMGQMLSAASGLVAWHLFTNVWVAMPVAVASATFLMLLLQCRHAPGGATALFIAMGGPAISALDWRLLWVNMLPSLLTLLVVATIFNAPFKWRRYPAIFATRNAAPSVEPVAANTQDIDHYDLVYASEHLKAYFEISETEFMEIYQAAKAHHQSKKALNP